MPTSRPLRIDDRLINVCPDPSIGLWTLFNGSHCLENYVLMSDFGFDRHISNYVAERIFGVHDYNQAKFISAIRRGTAPALYVREGDTVRPWSAYQAVLHERRMRALTERHQGFIAQLQLHGAGNIQLRIEDDVVVIRCSSSSRGALEGFAAEGVRIEITDAARSTLPSYADLEVAITADLLRQYPPLRGLNFPSNRYRATDQQRQMAERLVAAMNIPLTLSAAELGGTLADTPPPPPPPQPTRFNLLECDLPAVDPTPAKQKHFDALAELQASFRAAKVAAKTAVQPVLTRFDLLECDEPAEPVTVCPKWSAQPSAPKQRTQQQPQQPQPERRTVEDILDLTTSGPLEALAALQIAKAEILRDLWQRGTN